MRGNATVNGYGFNAVDTTNDFEDRLMPWKRANGAQNQSWSLTAIGASILAYDALGRRVARTQVANAVVYFHGLFSLAGIAPSSRWASLVTRRGGAVLFAHRNQQYSIYAYSNSSGAVVERIAYTAYGQPTFMNAAGTVQSTSPNSIRYSYTGREWDGSLQLHHFRARWMGPVTGRFLGRDPIEKRLMVNQYLDSFGLAKLDPSGMITIVRKSVPPRHQKCGGSDPEDITIRLTLFLITILIVMVETLTWSRKSLGHAE